MPAPALTVEQILTILAETPHRIAALSAGLPQDQLHAPPEPGAWSANDLLAHLRACADVWGGCIETILAQDRPAIRKVSPRTWIRRTDYPDQPFQPSFQAYTTQRDGLLAVLEVLDAAAWSRPADVKDGKKTRVRTLQDYAQQLAQHEQAHFAQIQQIANRLRPDHPNHAAA